MRRAMFSELGLGRACLACLDFALCAFVDVPVWSGMTQIAVPEDECGI